MTTHLSQSAALFNKESLTTDAQAADYYYTDQFEKDNLLFCQYYTWTLIRLAGESSSDSVRSQSDPEIGRLVCLGPAVFIIADDDNGGGGSGSGGDGVGAYFLRCLRYRCRE